MASNTPFAPLDLGYLKQNLITHHQLMTGEVGYIATGIKNIKLCRPGDTVIFNEQRSHTVTMTTTKSKVLDITPVKPLPGYKQIKPRVFTGVYPTEGSNINDLKDGLYKLGLNDASLTFSPESSPSLGSGFRLGCLGQFHLEIVIERLKREYDASVITTIPSVEYLVKLKTQNAKHNVTDQNFKVNQTISISLATELPDPNQIQEIMEPWIRVSIITPYDCLNLIIQLIKQCRGVLDSVEHLNMNQAKLIINLPLNELLEGFYDRLKSASSGYASFDYEFLEYRMGDIVKLDFLINKEIVEPLSILIHRDRTKSKATAMVEKLKDVIPPQQFSIPIQAAIGNKILARADLKAMRKDVTAKLYGGDRTRKDKLLKQQKKGKRRLKQYGKIQLSSDIFNQLAKK